MPTNRSQRADVTIDQPSSGSPTVSVIVPTYNRAALLPATLDSILAQTLPPLEIIVVDDGSTDDTAAVIAAYGDHVRYLPIAHSGLPAVARNAGLRAACGKLVAFCDSDDLWLPDKLEQQAALFAATPGLGLVCCNARVITPEGTPTSRLWQPPTVVSGLYDVVGLLPTNIVVASSALADRALVESLGGFTEDRRLLALEDYDLWLRIAALAPVAYDSACLVLYRDDRQSSVRGRLSQVDQWSAYIVLLDWLRRFLKSQGRLDAELERQLRRRQTMYLRQLAAVQARALQVGAALRTVRNMATLDPVTTGALLVQIATVKVAAALRRTKAVAKRLRSGHRTRGGLRLHLGCGQVYLPGYINVDYPPDRHSVQVTSRVDLYADIAHLRFPAASVDEVRLHHVFEHFDRVTALRLLIAWHSWLKPGGTLTIETPDFERSARVFLRAKDAQAKEKLLRHIFGSQEASWAIHYDGWYRAKYERVLPALGFDNLRFKRSAWRGTHNLTVTATKLLTSPGQLLHQQAVERLLALNLVDESSSETRLLQTWLERFHALQD